MTPANILKAAADLIEIHPDARHYTANQAIMHVAPSETLALGAIRAFSRFLRTDGVGSERKIGTDPEAIIAALRQACEEAS
jgi:hypothetical protein